MEREDVAARLIELNENTSNASFSPVRRYEKPTEDKWGAQNKKTYDQAVKRYRAYYEARDMEVDDVLR